MRFLKFFLQFVSPRGAVARQALALRPAPSGHKDRQTRCSIQCTIEHAGAPRRRVHAYLVGAGSDIPHTKVTCTTAELSAGAPL